MVSNVHVSIFPFFKKKKKDVLVMKNRKCKGSLSPMLYTFHNVHLTESVLSVCDICLLNSTFSEKGMEEGGKILDLLSMNPNQVEYFLEVTWL